jgi:hypothetical protein
MNNPWEQLPKISPFVLDMDRDAIDCFNDKYSDSPDFLIRTGLLPEPFFGNVDAPVYALCLNPGYSPDDDAWHLNTDFINAIRKSHIHGCIEHPHYYLNPAFTDAPGSRWWRRKCRWLIDDCGISELSRNLFCVELFPYHSRRYKPLPRSLSSNGFPESIRYTAIS